MGRAERVVYVEVGQGRELIREPRIITGLSWIESGVLKQHHAPAVPIIEGLYHIGADGGIELLYGLAEQLLEPRGDRLHSILLVGLALGTAEVRDQDRTSPPFEEVPDRRQRAPDTRVVRDLTILDGHVEVYAH
jgi:hypothetical protein